MLFKKPVLVQNIKLFINKILIIIGAYGIIQILAQDIGIKMSKKHREIITKMPIQIIFLYDGAFIITNDYILALISILGYYLLKYIS